MDDLLSLEDAIAQVAEGILSTASVSHGDPVKDFLAHFGIKGMKWGVRRSANQATDSEDHIRATGLRKKSRFGKTRRLSNEELRVVIERMNLEQQYSNLRKQKSGSGAKIAKELLVNFGKEQARKALTDAGANAIKNLLKK